jgi:hypothetical protein
MSLELHQKAEFLMARADQLAAEGNRVEASLAYRSAAFSEADALLRIPEDRVRTRGIIAVSTVALFRKAEAFREAIRYAHRYLGMDVLPEFAREELEELLDISREEVRLRTADRTVLADAMEWVFRGPAVGSGTAPISTVLHKVEQIEKFCIRVFEFTAGASLRQSGPIDQSLGESFELRIAEPIAGSFRFKVSFAAKVGQLPLISTHAIPTAERVSEVTSSILEGIEQPESGKLRSAVPHERYREVFVAMGRALLPDGKHLSTIEALTLLPTRPSRVVLTRSLRRGLTAELYRLKPAESIGTTTLRGTLRALDLNRGWIMLGSKGRETRCHVGNALVLEDVVGPLVNHPVRVRCQIEKGRFVIQDIEEDTSADGNDEDDSDLTSNSNE